MNSWVKSKDNMICVMKSLRWIKKTSIFCDIKSGGHAKNQMVGVVEFNSCISYVFEILQDAEFL